MREQAEILLREVAGDYPSLRLDSCEADTATYSGTVAFTANYECRGLIDDEFEVEIILPLSGSDKIPSAKETGGRIPREIDFHVNKEGIMCLGAPLDIRRKFKQTPSLRAFINHLLIPFLYSFSFKEKYGYMPFGELSHGSKGISEYYKALFMSDSDLVVLELLKIIVEDSYRGHLLCPCDSGEKLRHCHGDLIRDIKDQQNREAFFLDFIACLQVYMDSGRQVPSGLITKKIRGYLSKVCPKGQCVHNV